MANISYYRCPDINATNNNWGDPSGPLDDSDDRASGGWYNPNGNGNKVSDHVNYYPWTGATIVQPAVPTGLSGTHGNAAVNLKWDPIGSPDFGGYKIYYGTISGSYAPPVIVGDISSYKLTGLNNDTPYFIAISSMNTVGVESARSSEILLKPIYDVTSPTSTIVQPANGATITGTTITITGTADDGQGTGVNLVEVSTDNGVTWSMATGMASWTYDWQVQADGVYVIRTRATDNAENVEIPGQGISVTVALPPQLRISTLGDGAVTNDATLNISGYAKATKGIKSLTINATVVPVNSDGSFSHAIELVPGANAISVIAVDNNTNQVAENRNITYDATAPQLTVTEPADGALTATNTATVTGTIGSGVTSVNVKINGVQQTADISGSNYSTVVTLTSGMNTIEVIAADVAQHTNSIKRTVFFDVTKPGMAITLPVEDILSISNSLTISGVVDPAPLDAALRISTDGATFKPPTTVTGAGTTHITFDHPVTLTAEGYYPVTLQVRDSADNLLGATQRNVIYIQRTIIINKGAPFTITTAITLDLEYAGAASMQFSANGGTTWTAWMAYVKTKKLTLPSGDGLKTISVRFRDSKAGISGIYSAKITLDTKAPTNGTLTITPALNNVLNLSWQGFNDATSGIASYRLVAGTMSAPSCSATPIYAGPGTSFSHTNLTLNKTYYYRVCALDTAGNISTGATASRKVLSEYTPPTGSIVINNNDPYTKTAKVTLAIHADDNGGSGLYQMCVSNTATCTAWIPYATSKAWNLTTGDGPKMVNIWFKDKNGNATAPADAYHSNSILLDTKPPTNGTLQISNTFNLTWKDFTDVSGGSNLKDYILVRGTSGYPACNIASAINTSDPTATAYDDTTTKVAGKTYYYRVCARDNAGNISTGATASKKKSQ